MLPRGLPLQCQAPACPKHRVERCQHAAVAASTKTSWQSLQECSPEASTCSSSVSSICSSRPASPLRLRGRTCAATALAWDSAMAAAGHHEDLRLLGQQEMLHAMLASCDIQRTGSRRRLSLQSTMSHQDHHKISMQMACRPQPPGHSSKQHWHHKLVGPAARAAPQTRAADVLASPSLILALMAPARLPASSD